MYIRARYTERNIVIVRGIRDDVVQIILRHNRTSIYKKKHKHICINLSIHKERVYEVERVLQIGPWPTLPVNVSHGVLRGAHRGKCMKVRIDVGKRDEDSVERGECIKEGENVAGDFDMKMEVEKRALNETEWRGSKNIGKGEGSSKNIRVKQVTEGGGTCPYERNSVTDVT